MLNETHDPALHSWVPSANLPDTDFPIQNLPYAVFRPEGEADYRLGVAIGTQILDLRAAFACGAVAEPAPGVLGGDSLNALMGQGPAQWSALRLALSQALRAGSVWQEPLTACLSLQVEASYQLPARIGDYTDFYTSIYHATSVGKLFRPDNPLLPNYQWVPIGYHGRASSIRLSGYPVTRPQGQLMPAGAAAPTLAPCARLDYELELGIFIGQGNPLGSAIPLQQAESHVFGLCLLNDWSARDMQAWEYQPLGPFLSKSFLTTISPWVVTLEALAPYRSAWTRAADEPQPLPYLEGAENRAQGGLDIQLAVSLLSSQMRDEGKAAMPLSRSSYRHAYWTMAQMLAHHTVNGCNLQPGDLLGTGTQSGPGPEEAGSLLELSQGGRQALSLPTGEQRRFLEDGDEVVFTAWCERTGLARIGFGICCGRVQAACKASA